MKCGHHRDSLIIKPVTPLTRNLEIFVYEGLICHPAQRTDDLRFNDFNLFCQKRDARFYFIGFRIPVPWRTALDHVADINLIPGKPQNVLNDPVLWNRIVSGNGGIALHSWQWARAKELTGGEVIWFFINDERAQAAFPTYVKKIFGLIKRLRQ